MGLLAERDGRASLTEIIGRELASEAEHTAGRIETLVRLEQRTLESFARQEMMREIRVLDLDKRIAKALSTLQSGGTARTGYLVLDRDARVVAATDPDWIRARPDWASAATIERALSGVHTDMGTRGLLIATPIPDPDAPEHRLGILVGRLDWSLLTDVCDEVQDELSSRGLSAELFVVSEPDRTMRSCTRAGHEDFDATRAPRIAAAFSPSSGYVVDVERELLIGRSSFDTGSTAWKLLVVEPLSRALAPVVRLRNRLILTTALALAAALGLAAYGAERVLRPLHDLTHAIRDVGRGVRPRAPVPVRSDDEVGTLARSFNEMIEEIDEAQRQLVEAEKFALVGELAAGVAHEVRTSLGVLRSSAQILARSADLTADPNAREMLGMVGEEVDRLSRVVDDLLTLDHRRPLDLRPVRLSTPLDAAIGFVMPQAREKGVELQRTGVEHDGEVVCDAEALQQICLNLLSNALAGLEPGNRIEVRIEPPDDSSASFCVRDDGAGVPPELRERIFDPFVTGRRSGVGLGLTFVKRVVHSQNGTVELVSVPEPGACFRVTLPRAARAARKTREER